jgi:hypothetical protein
MSAQSDAEISAAERLARSRERMSFWLADESGSARTDAVNGGADHDVHSPVGALSVGGIVGEVVGEWWADHPLHTGATLALAASRSAIVPLVRRHPAAVLGSAAAVGAALVWARPWRWLLRPALILGIASQLAARTVTRMGTASRNASANAAARAPKHVV